MLGSEHFPAHLQSPSSYGNSDDFFVYILLGIFGVVDKDLWQMSHVLPSLFANFMLKAVL